MPRSLSDVTLDRVPLDQPGCWAARITKGATGLGDLISVVLEADGLETQGVRWMPRCVPVAGGVEARFPARGDRCVVVFDEGDDGYAAVWWPA
jgi:hypothetical protein